MASVIIHLCVAKKVNETLKMNERQLFLGAAAPDISKQIGEDRKDSHFLKGNLPDIHMFLDKYQDDLVNPFTMGYLIHLLTDFYWFSEFIPDFLEQNKINRKELDQFLYQDYTNLNIRLIDQYLLSLAVFYEEIPKIETVITEIPIDKLSILMDKIGIIIENSQNNQMKFLHEKEIIDFIEQSSRKIITFLEDNRL